MGKLTAQYHFRFTPEQWERLRALAAETHSIAPNGPYARQPSVAIMLNRIADDELVFVEKEPWSLPPGLAEAAEAEERRQRELGERQRLIDEQQRHVAEHMAHKQSVRKTPVLGTVTKGDLMTQLSMLELVAEPA